ncbi:unnamed protein product [Rotaria sp. Silwood1]|nr:unnamed protein product [Rotaria sp. Silwood1]
MPPPPPPPPPPPLLPASMTASGDRSCLLNEIGNFKIGALKKTITNDRSAPIIGGSTNNNTRNSTTNRSNINERPNTAPLITPNQLNATMLKPSAIGGSTGKVKRPSIPHATTSTPPPPPPPPPVHQPVVKTPSFDQSHHGIDGVASTRNFTHQAPRLPPREPPPPPPSNESKPKLGHPSSSLIGFQQKNTRAPPPPPPPYSSTNNDHSSSDYISKSPKQINLNGPPPAPPPPPPPPRGVAPTNNNGTIRRASSDFVDHSYSDRRYDQSNIAALDYDHHFEARFRFTPLEYLPIPERWQPPSAHTRSSKHHVNVR